jgi:phenylacetate-CoA ligase
LAERLKNSSAVDEALRRNPLYYRRAHALAVRVRGMERNQRRALLDELTLQTLRWARRTRAGRPGSDDFSKWPLVTKDQLRAHSEDFWGPGLLQVSGSTSGSTGIPVRLRRSLRCIAAEQAFVDEMMIAALASVGIACRSPRVARLRSDPIKEIDDREPPFGKRTHWGTRLVLSTGHVGPDTVQWFHEELRDFRPDVLFATPGNVERLALLMQASGLQVTIPVVMTSSETLHANARALLQKQFGGVVLDRYGLSERVASAVSVGASPYYFNPAYGRVELLPADVPHGQPGLRAYEIIATGFWNEAMPVIRFQTGDLALVPEHYGERDLEDVTLGVLPVSAIEGRPGVNVQTPGGQVIVGLPHVTKGVRGLLRLQVLQESATELQFLVLVDPQAGGLDRAVLAANIEKWVPRDVAWVIREVEELQRSASGKTPFILRRLPSVSP